MKTKKRRGPVAEFFHRLLKNKGAFIGLCIIIFLILLAVFADVLYDYDTQIIKQSIMSRMQEPSAAHPFGTDAVGRDILARVVYGTRYSLLIGFSSVALGMLIGVALGAIAGFFGGILESVIMRLSDVFSSIPAILMAMIIVFALGKNMFNLILAIAVTSVPTFIRITRSSVLTLRDQEYVEASRAIGVAKRQIIMRHILPNCLSPIIVTATLRIGLSIITASSLSFVGLGVPTPAPEWGTMLSEGRDYILSAGYMCVFPGLAIVITVLAINLMGDGLRDALDPHQKGASRKRRRRKKK